MPYICDNHFLMSLKITPKFSIIIPTYNRAQLITTAIDSILGQTYNNYEIIVVDDGSIDNTEEVLRQYSGTIKYFKQANKGQSAARNLGLQNALGEYIAPLDSDDFWEENYLEICLKHLEQHNLDLLITHWEHLLKKNNRQILLPEINKELRNKGFLILDEKTFSNSIFKKNIGANSGMVFRKEIVKKGWNENIKIGDDWVLQMDLISSNRKMKIGYNPEKLWNKLRVSESVCDGNKGIAFREAQLKDLEAIIKTYTKQLKESERKDLYVLKMQNKLLLLYYYILNRSSPKLIFIHLYSILKKPKLIVPAFFIGVQKIFLRTSVY